MKKFVSLVMLVLILAACTSGKTEYFPSRKNSTDAAEVTVIRQKRGFGMGFSIQVLLDGNAIARLKTGQYVTFFVDPGIHDIGVKKSTITVMLESGRKHYFMIETDSSQFGFEIERISEKKASARMAQSRPIN